ncbi:MAG: hypothetical protein FWF44_00050 [Defluviitaleaceae bacterium]|nr:hypothetical protein [Defluviitaleaceae bacterium]
MRRAYVTNYPRNPRAAPRPTYGDMIKDYYRRQQSKKPMEFSQKVLVMSITFAAIIVVATLAANFLLLWNGKQPMTDETVIVVSTYGGITSGVAMAAYTALTAVRNNSFNKHVTKTHILTDAANAADNGTGGNNESDYSDT